MQSVGKFHTHAHYNTLLVHKPILQFPSKPYFSLSTRLNFNNVHGKLRNELYCNALKPKKKGDLSSSEMDGPDELDEDDDGFLDIGDDGGFDVDEEEDEIEMPLMNMKKWLENKPRGFGEGKVYDTSVEDKLMEEIEHIKKAQLANVNKLKNNSSPVDVNKQDKGSTLVQDGFRVRLLNLPKKKNIHKDLKLSFQGVSGILNIVPVVSGNEKTRDPVCKGIAFIDFKNQADAQSFMQRFSGKSISFGKVEKQIKCEMVNPKKLSPPRDQSEDDNNFTAEQAVVNSGVNEITTGFQTDVSLLKSRQENVPSFDNSDENDDKIKGTSSTTTSEPDSSKQIRKLKANKKKVVSKGKKDKVPKLNIPGSANRLKIREKEMLSGVFSKYSATVKELSR
ncbi:hypothetical protein CASFOL_024040 [Castilleja foliolosa]|uniref:RRM domain-containing protein n=1 Tax=Castilleja foliolosa TaxID=1961234 RepID=A0ABD3CM79_9LAMI